MLVGIGNVNQKIPKKYSGIALGGLIPLVMGVIMSFIITTINLGFVDNFPQKWLEAYIGSITFGLPLGSAITPFLKKFIESISEK